MVDVTYRLDLSHFYKMTNQVAQLAGERHREWLTSQMQPQIQQLMQERLRTAYTQEIDGGSESHKAPTITTGKWWSSVVWSASSAGRVTRAMATAPYAGYVEDQSFAATGDRLKRTGRRATAAAFQSQFGKVAHVATPARERAVNQVLAKNEDNLNELQLALVRWCALKFPGNQRSMTNIINKVLTQGYGGRFLMASAFTARTPGGAAFLVDLREHLLAGYTDFLINFYREAAS